MGSKVLRSMSCYYVLFYEIQVIASSMKKVHSFYIKNLWGYIPYKSKTKKKVEF